jgi:hypothetical protein
LPILRVCSANTCKPRGNHAWRTGECINFQTGVIGKRWQSSCSAHCNCLEPSIAFKRVGIFHYICQILGSWYKINHSAHQVDDLCNLVRVC